MKYKVEEGILKFNKPLRKTINNGIKIFFYLDPNTERDQSTYPVAYADAKRGQGEINLPHESIKLLGVLIKEPKYKFFPFVWYRWEVCEEILK